ncbi:hypothetical protein SAMN05216464_107284 [Mucilaginibacter pineti]|uniref:Uncharacterized protein n=1 Tax=Mucilaginibacter pineti TaxID=1391627 RepID=A0A1G7E6D8_9SPHI|nr:hypothetical protein SAMN05216464_107284 [Mucilaginibacter pineti]
MCIPKVFFVVEIISWSMNVHKIISVYFTILDKFVHIKNTSLNGVNFKFFNLLNDG